MMTNKEAFLKKHNLPEDTTLSLREISKLSGMPLSALKMVYNKGIGAYYTNPISVRTRGTFQKNVDVPMSQKLSPQQWAVARVYAFAMKSKKVFYDADRHIAEMYNLI